MSPSVFKKPLDRRLAASSTLTQPEYQYPSTTLQKVPVGFAGWNPDETYWFSLEITYDYQYTRWALQDSGTDMVWKPASAETS